MFLVTQSQNRLAVLGTLSEAAIPLWLERRVERFVHSRMPAQWAPDEAEVAAAACFCAISCRAAAVLGAASLPAIQRLAMPYPHPGSSFVQMILPLAKSRQCSFP